MIDQSFEQLSGRVTPLHQLGDVCVGHADQLSHHHHGQAVGHGAHPFDASVAQALDPKSVRGAYGELLDGANPLGRQVPDQQFAVHRVGRIVSGRQYVGGSAEGVHL